VFSPGFFFVAKPSIPKEFFDRERPLTATIPFGYVGPNLGGVSGLGTITKRPRARGPLFFLCFSRGSWDTQPNLARVQIFYVPFDFFLAFFFMTLFLSVGPLSQSKQWQQADERGVNRS
jgi:hypothetical protein